MEEKDKLKHSSFLEERRKAKESITDAIACLMFCTDEDIPGYDNITTEVVENMICAIAFLKIIKMKI